MKLNEIIMYLDVGLLFFVVTYMMIVVKNHLEKE